MNRPNRPEWWLATQGSRSRCHRVAGADHATTLCCTLRARGAPQRARQVLLRRGRGTEAPVWISQVKSSQAKSSQGAPGLVGWCGGRGKGGQIKFLRWRFLSAMRSNGLTRARQIKSGGDLRSGSRPTNLKRVENGLKMRNGQYQETWAEIAPAAREGRRVRRPTCAVAGQQTPRRRPMVGLRTQWVGCGAPISTLHGA